jgi:hypothetical protein
MGRIRGALFAMDQDQAKDPDLKLVGQREKPNTSAKRGRLYLIPYLLLPILLILLAHYFIDIRFDVSLTYFRALVFLIAFGVGFLLCSVARTNIAVSLLAAIIITIAALLGMSGIVWIARGAGSLVPASSREWQDVIDFSISVISAALAGHVAANFLQSTFPSFEPRDLAQKATKSIVQDPAAATRRIKTTEALIKALSALILAAAGLYAGIRGLFG